MVDLLLSIDPGNGGATVGWVAGNPDIIIPHEGCNDQSVSVRKYAESIAGYLPHDIGNVTVVCEQVGARFNDGKSRVWSFAYGLGRLHGIIDTLLPDAEWCFVRPQDWQRDLGCLTGGNKNVTKDRAAQLWPEWKITHRNADALLIGYWWLNGGE